MARHDTLYERDAPHPDAVARAMADARFGVGWFDGLARPTRAGLVGRRDADLVVVGGGYAGLWTAVLAKRRDPSARVVLLEAKRVGWAASGRNGGWVDHSITHGEANGRARWAGEYETLTRLGFENLDAMERDLAELGVGCDFERVGAMSLVVEEHQREWAAEATNPWERTLDAAAARAVVDAPGLLGGIAVSGRAVATCDPAKLVLGLADAAEALGVEIYEGSRVLGVERDGERVVATTASGRVVADRAALATNVFPPLLKRNALMTVPVYDYVVMTEPLDAAQRAAIGWSGRQGLGDLANQFHYAQITRDGRILWGGYDAVYHPGGRIRRRYEDAPEIHARLTAHLFAFLPQLAETGVRIAHRWAGVIDTSTRFAAFFGSAWRGRVAYTAGYTGLGVAATRFGAEVMLDLLGGEPTERTELEMVRHRGVPFPPEPAATIGIGLSRWSMDRADHNEGRRNVFLRTMDALGLGFDS